MLFRGHFLPQCDTRMGQRNWLEAWEGAKLQPTPSKFLINRFFLEVQNLNTDTMRSGDIKIINQVQVLVGTEKWLWLASVDSSGVTAIADDRQQITRHYQGLKV